MIEIINFRNHSVFGAQPWDFRVDRGSPVGNPYEMKYEDHRDWVCDMFEATFDDLMKTKVGFREYIEEMIAAYQQYGTLRLWCWCAPKRCHAETIRNYIEDCVGEFED